MAEQKYSNEVLPALLDEINTEEINGAGIDAVLEIIDAMDITHNHDAIITALDNLFRRMKTCKLEQRGFFNRVMANIRAQKEMAEKVVKYEGLLDYDEFKSFIRSSFSFLRVGGPVKLSINFPGNDFGLWHVVISSDSEKHLPVGLFQMPKRDWFKKFTRFTTLPQVKKEIGETITLPNGATLQFVSKSWWLSEAGDLTSVDQPRTKKITRSDAWNLLAQSGILGEVSEEAFEDLNTMEDEE